MGRSVDYLNNAVVILYFTFENEYFDNGEFDQDGTDFSWQNMELTLISEIQDKLPSYYKEDGKWDGRETRIILSNNFCNIGISEYCGLVSLSVAPKEVDGYYSDNQYKENFAKHHAGQIKSTLVQILRDMGLLNLKKIGVFSNGEAVFEKAV